MSDNIDVRDGMLFESTERARVQERFVVGQDERHTVPLVRRWLALGTVRPVPPCGAICPDRLSAAGKPCGEPRGHGPETMHRVDLGGGDSSSWADIGEVFTPFEVETRAQPDPHAHLRRVFRNGEEVPRASGVLTGAIESRASLTLGPLTIFEDGEIRVREGTPPREIASQVLAAVKEYAAAEPTKASPRVGETSTEAATEADFAIARWVANWTAHDGTIYSRLPDGTEWLQAAFQSLPRPAAVVQSCESAFRALPRLAAEVLRLRADNERLGEIQCLAYELGAALRGTMQGDAPALVAKIGALTLLDKGKVIGAAEAGPEAEKAIEAVLASVEHSPLYDPDANAKRAEYLRTLWPAEPPLTAERIEAEVRAATPKLRTNPDGTIHEDDAQRVERHLLALTGAEHHVDRSRNIVAERMIRVTPRYPHKPWCNSLAHDDGRSHSCNCDRFGAPMPPAGQSGGAT